jgi:transposase InsO family protein
MFVAKYVDSLWHTDLHELQLPGKITGGAGIFYLIAFLDDASRYIMHHRLIPDKRVDTCAAVLAETFQMRAPPCVLGTDNGGEFTGEAFTSGLRQHGVTPWRTKPYTPEQNGKMERFWRSLEHARAGKSTAPKIARIMQFYKYNYDHCALRMTPSAAEAAGINWRSPNAVIDDQIERNLTRTA